MNFLLHLTDEQYAKIEALAEKKGTTPFEIVLRCIKAGWPLVERARDRKPVVPARKSRPSWLRIVADEPR